VARVFPERLAQLDQVIGGVFWVLGAQIALVQRSGKLTQAIASVIQCLQANFGYEGLDVFGFQWQFFTAVNDGVYVFCAAFQLGGEDTSACFFVHAVAKCGHDGGTRLFYMLRCSLFSLFCLIDF
jgi:hypothetical protein